MIPMTAPGSYGCIAGLSNTQGSPADPNISRSQNVLDGCLLQRVSDAVLRILRRPGEFRRMDVFILTLKSPENSRPLKGSVCGPFFF